ncbi:MAG: trypsin-like peptidase domain-containing protein [Planctomycetaceae bacterium]
MPAPRHPFRAVVALVCLATTSTTSAPAAAPAAAAAAGDVLLLDFAATWCGPCRQMAGLVSEVAAAGWSVRHVDVDREHDLVRRFGVTGVPCYILLVKGREVGRIDGATTREALEQLLARSGPALGAADVPPPAAAVAEVPVPGIPLPVAAAAAPLATEPPRPPAANRRSRAVAAASDPSDRALPVQPEPIAPPAAVAAVPAATAQPAGSRGELERRLLHATARLRVEDTSGVSWGTGTVIDCRQGEALILTCGHIFRDSAGKGRVEVDLFAPGGGRRVAGQVVSWDLKRDLALVSVFTDVSLEPVRVGGGDCRVAPGEAVVTVGCNGGADPTIHHSRVTAVDKYLGPPNVQVAGQPVQGRSGGGLFAIDGTLVGVCNAADPEDNEGLFAALPAIHEQLEEAGLAFVYRAVYPSNGLDAVANAAVSGPPLPMLPSEMPDVSFDRRSRSDALPTASTAPHGAAVPPAAAVPGAAAGTEAGALAHLSSGERALVDHVRQHGGNAEVICIVRPRGAADDSSEVFVLKDSGRGFVERLADAHGGAAPVTDRRPPAPSPASR